MRWSIDCVQRVLPYFEREYPNDLRPQLALETAREWLRTGIFKMAVIRKASLDAHAAARAIADFDPAHSAARAAGQAVATAHAAGHAIVAAIYAATTVRDATDSLIKVNKEREWQYQRLLKLIVKVSLKNKLSRFREMEIKSYFR